MKQATTDALRSLPLHRLLVALSLLVPLAVFAVVAVRDYAAVRREGEEVVTRTAAVMHEHARKVFETVELTLARVDDHLAGLSPDEIAAPGTSAFLVRLKAPLEHVVSIWVSGADGTIQAGSQPWDPSILLRNREFFTVHREQRDAGTFVSAAFRGRATGVASFAVSRRRTAPDGRFGGVIHVSISPEYFARAFAEAAPPMPHAAALIRGDGEVLAREPYRDVNAPLSTGSPLLAAIARRPEGGFLIGRSTLDGVERAYAYRQVGAWPVYVGFGTETAELMRRWRENLAAFGVVSGTASLMLLLVSWLALRAAGAERVAVARLGAALGETEARVAARTVDLATSEERLRLALDAGRMGVFAWDFATDRLTWDERQYALFGADPAEGEMTGERALSLVHPEDRPALEVAIRSAMDAGQGTFAYEFRVPRRDGTTRWIAGHGQVVAGPDGGAARMIGLNSDVTRSHEAEAALARSNAEVRLAAERVQLALAAGAIIGTWDWDLPTDRFTVDERFAENFGIDPALGQSDLSLEQVIATVHPDDLPGLRVAIADVTARGGAYAHQYRVRGRDGAYRWIEANGRVDHAPDGTPMRFPGVLLDIERRHAAEAERDRAAGLLRAFADAVPGVAYVKDREGRVLVANAGVAALVGKPLEEVVGRTDAEFLGDPAQAAAVMANDRRIMESGVAEQIEEEVSLPGGMPGFWLSTKAPFRDAEGRIIGLVGASVDITERKQAEDRLRLMLDELNHRVKNTLATVQAIASQTLRGTDPAIRRILEGRLLALSSAHDVLTRERWEGAELLDVVAGALAPHGGAEGGRFQVSGPALRLSPRAALALAMGLHELATNALKYGALSVPSGVVELRWEVSAGDGEPRFRMNWTERGGPPVALPARRGFGTKLVERSLAQDLGGTVQIGFDDPAGVTCVIEAPLAEVAAPAEVLPFPQVGGGRGDWA